MNHISRGNFSKWCTALYLRECLCASDSYFQTSAVRTGTRRLNKKEEHFSSVSSGLSREGQCAIHSGEKSHKCVIFFIPARGKDLLNHLSLHRMGTLGAAPPVSHLCCGEGCSGTVSHTLTCLMNLWLVRSPVCTLPRDSGAALEALIKLLLCRRILESLWVEIHSSQCLYPAPIWAMPTNRRVCLGSSERGNMGEHRKVLFADVMMF